MRGLSDEPPCESRRIASFSRVYQRLAEFGELDGHSPF